MSGGQEITFVAHDGSNGIVVCRRLLPADLTLRKSEHWIDLLILDDDDYAFTFREKRPPGKFSTAT